MSVGVAHTQLQRTVPKFVSRTQKYATQRTIRKVFVWHNHQKQKKLGFNHCHVYTKISYGGSSLRHILVWSKTFLTVLSNLENKKKNTAHLHIQITIRLFLAFLFISSLQFNDFLDIYRGSFYPILDFLLGKLFPSCFPNLYSLCSVSWRQPQKHGSRYLYCCPP